MRQHPAFPVVFVNASYGNDSIALIQWAHEHGLASRCEAHVIYADTGWARKEWRMRVHAGESFARALGFRVHRTASVGFKNVVRAKKGFPRQGIQFCTQMLKVEPLAALCDEIDPARRATVLIGKRRAESANRANTQEFVASDPYNGGRGLWHPLYLHSDEDRNELVRRAGFRALAHRSDECWPCINANKGDLRRLEDDPDRLAEIEAFEHEMGFTSKGKPRTMYRPYRYRGATGIRAMVRWANTDRGADFDDGTGRDCSYGSSGCGL